MKTWKPDSWRSKKISQLPTYPDLKKLTQIEQRLSTYPPLVFAGETERLKTRLADVAAGNGFLLHGGDCAESFADLNTNTLQANFKILLQMAIILTYALKKHIVKIGRTAGQFAKPRSSDTETRDGVTLPSYRGDIINGFEFEKNARIPDPDRMERAYFHAAATLNLMRAFAQGGFADLEQIHAWNLDFIEKSPQGQHYKEITHRVQESMSFMNALGINGKNYSQIREIEFYTSHESLLLPYEQALTRQDSGNWYDCSAHLLWIGERTRQLDSAHIEFLRGVSNPIGLKCSSQLDPDELIRLIDLLNPQNNPGRLTLITRFGHEKIEEFLPGMIKKIQAEGKQVVWCCDPMHGNTLAASNGYKTRNFQHVLNEAQKFLAIHEAQGSYAGGVHFEMTGSNVVECVGGDQEITEDHLSSGLYETLCDPRLNANQALELAFKLIA
ncbi:MAG: 3-deoxy-7-phosphoheptulonate synthase class II [Myxococcaceae bacterium]